uniref:Uncharacterized protein n=1 Tax=Oryza rufipogon TaxID=4529 RepID=A0A0E0P5M9_ORYRU
MEESSIHAAASSIAVLRRRRLFHRAAPCPNPPRWPAVRDWSADIQFAAAARRRGDGHGPGRSDGEDGFTVVTTIMRQSTDSGETWHSKPKLENDLRL